MNEKSIKEVLFFSNGDPNSASTWSNIPFLFATTLMEKGIKVRTVQLLKEHRIQYIYDTFIRRILKILFRAEICYYPRTRLHNYLAYKRIKKTVLKYPEADLCIFINYAFFNKYSRIPSLLLSDWPASYDIAKFNREPSSFERRFIKQETKSINSAEYVVTLFDTRRKEMEIEFPKANICYLGGNVINNLNVIEPLTYNTHDITTDEIKKLVEIKKKSYKILFIGKPDRYKEAAEKLLKAVGELRKYSTYQRLELHIIGFTKRLSPEQEGFVYYHGYLRKEVSKERDLYYALLKEAHVVVNATPFWAGFSSIIEAMYFFTPVIVSKFDEFVREFGMNEDFGFYCHDFSVAEIANNLKKIFQEETYEEKCIQAHCKVSGYTWSIYVDKVLSLVQRGC